MKIKKLILLVFAILLLSGCTITYNLDISEKGFEENINIIANLDENLEEYAIPAYFGAIGYEDLDASYLEKIEDIEYYNSSLTHNGETVELNYNYEFDQETIQNSNILNSSYGTIVIRKYDHNEDGKEDYMILSTDKDINIFEKISNVETIKVNIKCRYEVISSNAEEVDKDVYTWYLNKNEPKAINIVYNPEKPVDYRTLWEKILDGEYTNIFTISIIIFIIGLIIYKILKVKGDIKNKI